MTEDPAPGPLWRDGSCADLLITGILVVPCLLGATPRYAKAGLALDIFIHLTSISQGIRLRSESHPWRRASLHLSLCWVPGLVSYRKKVTCTAQVFSGGPSASSPPEPSLGAGLGAA